MKGTARLIEALASLTSSDQGKRAIEKAGVPLDSALVEQITDEVPVRARVDLRQASRLADTASWIAAILQDDYAIGRSLRARGHVLALEGNSEAALDAYESAIQHFRAARRPNEEAITRSGSLQVLIYLGRYTQAYSWAKQARRIFEMRGDRLRLARLDTNFANVLYRQDRFAEALTLYRRAHRTLARSGSPNDVAIALRNMAVCYISLNHFDAALLTHRKARRYAERHNLPLLVAETDYNIAYLYYLRGEYSRAIELYDATRRRCQRLGDRYHLALCDLDESELSLELNLTEDSARLGRHAFARFAALDMNYEAAKALTWLGIAAAQASDPGEALRFLAQARQRFRRERNALWLAMIDIYQAIVLFEDGRLEQARRLAEAALAVFTETGLTAKAALAELVLARIALRGGDGPGAERLCHSALERLATTQAPALRFQASFVLGQIQEALGRQPAAADAYLEAHAWLESLRTDLRAEETKIAFLKDKLVVYESVVAIALAGGPRVSKTAAFTFIEQAKSRSLADLIAFHAPVISSHRKGSQAAARRLHQLRESLNWCYREIDIRELSLEEPGARVDALRARARKLENEITGTLTEVRLSDDEYASLQNAGTADLPTIQASLEDDSLIVEYYAARGVLCACVIGRNTFDLVPLAAVDEVRATAQLLQFQMSKFRLGGAYRRQFSDQITGATNAHLQALHAALLAPLRSRIDNRPLTIVPHGFLHYVPFHALTDGRTYLIDSGAISYAPSASIYYLCRQKPQTHGGMSLVLGVSDRTAPLIDEEVEQVASVLPKSHVFKGRRASVSRLRDDGPRSRVIHIAAHAAFRMDNPMFSAIHLGDGPVNLFDLYDLQVSAELVTLSGCGTGLNALIGGDELVGHVRGWLYAGARSVLVSLWDVSDRSTADLMAHFYAGLRAGLDKASALRKAMLAIREREAHPYYWAPFVLVGNRTPIFSEPPVHPLD